MNDNYKDKIFLGEDFLKHAYDATEIKKTLLGVSSLRYIMRAAMAGLIVTFGYIVYILINADFNESANLALLGHFYSCWFFGFCLIFIYYVGAELLTSNMMLFSVSLYYKNTTVKNMLKVFIYCYLGNLIGGIIVGGMVGGTSMLTGDGSVEYMRHILEVKQGYLTTPTGVYDLFIRAVFCNFFINLAMLTVYSGKIKSDIGKCLVMFGGVFIFLYAGLEHSVANSTFFVLAGFLDLLNPTISLGFEFPLVVGNVLIALVGNFIGGGALIGLYYAFLNDKEKALK